MNEINEKPLILVTGATGYIGGRLYPRLLKKGFRVRCMAREPSHVQPVIDGMEVVRADVRNEESLMAALNGVHTAYYMIHSMGSSENFEKADTDAAHLFAACAEKTGVTHIIYLGGLADETTNLSPHLRSRHEVGEILRSYSIVVTELRASIIIGSGSLSFEMIRALTERLPIMITPRWVDTKAQPIAIRDILAYLVEAAEKEPSKSSVYEIGGADVVSYRDIMFCYAELRGLKRRMIPVPVLTPRLSSLWLGLVTPLYARVGKILVESLKYPTVCNETSALKEFSVRPMGYREATEAALRQEDHFCTESSWTDAMSSSSTHHNWGGTRFGNRLVDSRSLHVPVSAEKAFAPIQRIGGKTGWYYGNFLWKVRGWLDSLAGGPGMRRGRKNPEFLQVGDALDCWRVEHITAPERLVLRAEMKLPGRAWLEFKVEPDGSGSKITQTATFDPLGLSGILYWYTVYPLHELIFANMLKNIGREVMKSASGN